MTAAAAAGFVGFVSDVFGVPETVKARTPLPDGKLIHAQLRLGTVDLMVADRLDGWPPRAGPARSGAGPGRRVGRRLQHAG